MQPVLGKPHNLITRASERVNIIVKEPIYVGYFGYAYYYFTYFTGNTLERAGSRKS